MRFLIDYNVSIFSWLLASISHTYAVVYLVYFSVHVTCDL